MPLLGTFGSASKGGFGRGGKKKYEIHYVVTAGGGGGGNAIAGGGGAGGLVSSFDEGPVSAIADVERVGEVFGVVFNGMGITLYTTLVGAVFNLWLKFNYAIVEHGTAYFLAGLISNTD